MPLPEALRGSTWTDDTARKVFPILVWCAHNDKKITYGQLDEEIQRRKIGHHVNVVVYGHPAGSIGNALVETERQTGVKIPPLNALLVNARSGVPGSGCDYYLKHHLEKVQKKPLTPDQRRAMAEDTMKEIWSFQSWDALLDRYGLKPLRGKIPALAIKAKSRKLPSKGGWSNEPESKEHKVLKEWVAKNPKILKSKIPFRNGAMEWLYASADKVDVMFEHAAGSIAVEVKSSRSNDKDLERGIYQCVKYQALLRAELKARGLIPNGLAVLVSEQTLPQRLLELADLLGVRVIKVPVKRV